MGPLISSDQHRRVLGYLDSASSEGAEAIVGGKRWGDRGYFVEPTVLTCTHERMKVLREEIFGPVVCAIPFDDPEEIIRAANDTPFGLGAAVFTRDVGRAHRVVSKLRAGTVWVNAYHLYDVALPFGGHKQSGWGREFGREGVEMYTELKSVIVNTI
jgi:acyl-CoA reductase-like NAD-dependent aldehyde dehydrogenase